MSYIGNQPTQIAFVSDLFTGDASTTAFTMSVAPANTASVLVAIYGVLQDPTTYSVSGRTLTFSAAPPAGTGNISVRYLGIPATGVTTTAYRTITEFTATASQTTFTPPYYTVGFVSVYRNGVRLGSADYTATNGTTIVLATICAAGDLVAIESFYVSSVLNAIPSISNAVTDSLINSVSASKITGSRTLPNSVVPAGTVLQVVEGTTSSETFTTSTSYVTTNLTATITPTSATSKILVTVNSTIYASNSSNAMHGTLYRNGSDIASSYSVGLLFFGEGAVGWVKSSNTSLDSPASTSALTYTLYIKTSNGSYSAAANRNNSRNSIILQEIAA